MLVILFIMGQNNEQKLRIIYTFTNTFPFYFNTPPQTFFITISILAVNPKNQYFSSDYQHFKLIITLNIMTQAMNKNYFSGPKSYKSNPEGYKLTSSMIIENCTRMSNTNIVTVTPLKASKDNQNPKTHKYQRHFSQQDLKRHFNHHSHHNQPNYHLQPVTKAEDQYFPEISSAGKNVKHVYSIQKNQKSSLKPLYRDKKIAEHMNLRVNVLKQTSSTQSAQNLCLSKNVPNFVRTKLIKNNPSQESLHNKVKYNLRRQNFKIISKLGEGKFGKVFLVKQIQTGFVLAMKIIEKKKIIHQKLLDQFIRELKIQSFLNHPYIISLYGFFSDETHFYTLMQLGCDGQLYSVIFQKKILAEETTSFIIKNLLEAIGYVHENKILHRDIKPENIVLVLGNVKICDFGWAVNKMHPGEMRTTFCGTPLYLSPEIIQGSLYNQKVDLWAIGILAFELYLGCTPFQIQDQNDLFKIVTSSIKFPTNKDVSSQFKEFISAMLQKNPGDRLNSKKLLQMSFITKYSGLETCEQLCK